MPIFRQFLLSFLLHSFVVVSLIGWSSFTFCFQRPISLIDNDNCFFLFPELKLKYHKCVVVQSACTGLRYTQKIHARLSYRTAALRRSTCALPAKSNGRDGWPNWSWPKPVKSDRRIISVNSSSWIYALLTLLYSTWYFTDFLCINRYYRNTFGFCYIFFSFATFFDSRVLDFIYIFCLTVYK